MDLENYRCPEEEQPITLDELLFEFVPDENVEPFKAELEKLIEANSLKQAGELIRRLALQLSDTKYGYAVARAIGLTDGRSLAKVAQEWEVSEQYLAKLQRQVEEALGDNWQIRSLEAPRKPKEVESPEGTVTLNEAANLLNVSRTQAGKLLKQYSVSYGVGTYGSYFYNQEEVIDLKGKLLWEN